MKHTCELKNVAVATTGGSVNVYGSSVNRGTCWHDMTKLTGKQFVRRLLLLLLCFCAVCVVLLCCLNNRFNIFTRNTIKNKKEMYWSSKIDSFFFFTNMLGMIKHKIHITFLYIAKRRPRNNTNNNQQLFHNLRTFRNNNLYWIQTYTYWILYMYK